MKRTALTFFLILNGFIYAQNVGIGTMAPDQSAKLDISDPNRGLLIPRVALVQTTSNIPVVSPATSLLVYNTAAVNDVTPGFYYWNGSIWSRLATGALDWTLTGNAGTTDGTNFIGTTDNVPFNIRVNNQKAGRIDGTLNNTFIGYQAGSATVGDRNTAVGSRSLTVNTTGFGNIGVGSDALYSNTTGTYNVANGAYALQNTTVGSSNIAYGYATLRYNVAGNDAVAIGSGAMQYANNTGVGYSNRCVAVGYEALRGSTAPAANTGNNNTTVGYMSMYNNTSGFRNTSFGTEALFQNTTGGHNAATGSGALFRNTSGLGNSGHGSQVLSNNDNGNFNTSNGYRGLFSNLSGSYNVAEGGEALYSSTTGNYNTGVGYRAGYNVTSGSSNIIIGANIDAPTPTGNNQLTIGNLIFGTNMNGTGTTISTGNVGVGISNPSAKISSGSSFGNKIAAYDDGVSVAGLGIQAGLLQMFTSNNTSDIVFGFGNSAALTENVRIKGTGNVGIGTDTPNQRLSVRGVIEIENTFDNIITSRNTAFGLNHHIIGTFMGWSTRGIFLGGYNVNNPGGAYDAANRVYCGGPAGTLPISATAFTVVSAQRYKQNIVPITHGLEAVMHLNPVQYQYNFESLKQTHLGLIAEEVNEIMPEIVVKQNENGEETIDPRAKAMGINYTELVPVLIKSIQEQQEEIEGLRKRIVELEMR